LVIDDRSTDRTAGILPGLREAGRTYAVNILCPRSILIEREKIVTDGATPQVLSVYYSREAPEDSALDLTNKPRAAAKRGRLHVDRDATLE
jgi:hypothetical protein